MKKIYALTKEQFNELPEEIRKQALETLKVYHCVTIEFYNGEYHEAAMAGILGHYPEDHKFIGNAYDDDMYTEKERILNYVESFHDYPREYKGKYLITYPEFKTMPYNAKFGYDENGDIIRVK